MSLCAMISRTASELKVATTPKILNGRPEEIGRDGTVGHVDEKWLYHLPTVLVSARANHHRFDVGRCEVLRGAHVPISIWFCPDGEDVVSKEIADIVRRRSASVSSPCKVSFLGDTSERWLSVDAPFAERLAFGVRERFAQLVPETADRRVAGVHDLVKVVVVTDLDCCVDLCIGVRLLALRAGEGSHENQHDCSCELSHFLVFFWWQVTLLRRL